MEKYREVLQELGAMVVTGTVGPNELKELVEKIRAARNYRWVGLYTVSRGEFIICAATGTQPPTYPRFPVTQGLAGAALESRETIVVADVQSDPRYLPTFCNTRSEVIVPVCNDSKKVVGILDAESEKTGAFGKEDKEFLEAAAALLAHPLS